MTAIKSLYKRHLYVTPVALDRDGIATSQHTVAATAMTLDGVLASGGTYTSTEGTGVKVGHLIGVYCSANIASDVFTIVGTSPDGSAQTETVTGVNASTVFTTLYFYTVSSVKNNTTEAVNNVEVGIGSTLATERTPIEAKTNYAVGLGVTVSGTANVSAQLTMDDIFDSSITPAYIADGTLASKTGTFYSLLSIPVTAVRFITSSYSSGAVLSFHILQNKSYS